MGHDNTLIFPDVDFTEAMPESADHLNTVNATLTIEDFLLLGDCVYAGMHELKEDGSAEALEKLKRLKQISVKFYVAVKEFIRLNDND